MIPFSKKDVDIDSWETSGPLLHFHNWLNIRNIDIYQICINTDHQGSYFLRFYKAVFIIKIHLEHRCMVCYFHLGISKCLQHVNIFKGWLHLNSHQKTIVLERAITKIRHLHQCVNYGSICEVMKLKQSLLLNNLDFITHTWALLSWNLRVLALRERFQHMKMQIITTLFKLGNIIVHWLLKWH